MKLYVNLKSNHTRKSFKAYKERLDNFLGNFDEDISVFVPANAFSEGVLNFTQGAQNFYPAKSGAFTGEITSDQLEEFDIKTVLIGHSERRALGENEELLKAKFDYAVSMGWKIIYCIGENKQDFEDKKTNHIVDILLKNIDLGYNKLSIAYEPIYSIGSGIAASLASVTSVASHIRKSYKGELLYGGSVNVQNMEDFRGCVDGLLIGSAGVCVDNFIEIIKRSRSWRTRTD